MKLMKRAVSPAGTLPVGVKVRTLTMHPDERGSFTEFFREEWDSGIAPLQWNVVKSHANVLRGVHVHVRHDDYLILLEGRASIGLCDLRKRSPTEGVRALLEMRGERLEALVTPHGVAHGFYFHTPSVHIYGVSEYFNPADELGCHWADPNLDIPWPTDSPLVSARDAAAPSFSDLLDQLEPWQPIGRGP